MEKYVAQINPKKTITWKNKIVYIQSTNHDTSCVHACCYAFLVVFVVSSVYSTTQVLHFFFNPALEGYLVLIC